MIKLSSQISFADVFQECKEIFQNDKPKFLRLLTEHLDFTSLVPPAFCWAYYKALGRDRKYSLHSMLAALTLQKILGIPTVSFLILFLVLCREAREFCGFSDVPDNAQFTRFKQDFIREIEAFFHHLVDLTEPLCQRIDSHLASALAFDTSGIEAYVTENNPKFLNSIIRKLKRAYKDNPDIDIYNMAFGLMPSCASANNEIRQMYINGYFCYVYKFAIITNGLGIVRDIAFLDDDFKSKHPQTGIEKKPGSPDEDKSLSDHKALKPVLTDYFNLHPDASYDTFLGDSIFDSYDTYPFLLKECGFKKALIPINPRNTKPDIPKSEFNDSGWPLCPLDTSKTLKPAGWTRAEGRSDRFKWVCPETHWEGRKLVCHCPNPCTDKPSGRMLYTSPVQNLRLYPGIIRETEEWEKEYKRRCVIERTIHYLKEPLGAGNPKTRDRLTIKADLLLACIAQLLTVIVADSLSKPGCFRSLKSLIA